MKKRLCLLLILSMLLCGCASEVPRLKEPVTFYYLMEDYQFGENPQVFAKDLREAAGHRADLSYLLTLYMMGPSQEGMVSPLPKDARILGISQGRYLIHLKLTDTAETMTDVDFTRACACLSMTCMGLTGAEKVVIQSGSRSVTMTQNTMLLFDDSLDAVQEETK